MIKSGSWHEIDETKEGEYNEFDLEKTFRLVINSKSQFISAHEVEE